ncbi:MAG TPA: branched-chain amino acid ABC transporter permease [Ktedonobacterales bacterium]|jgi:branched-chain amino acid transport system permease protein|nr:branched-chain amino acid ABC transporter permease [Ktedonobacterales bacterium]
MATLFQLVFGGLALGCNYALIALGFTIIYKASKVINFAQGNFLLVGAYIVSVAMFAGQLNFAVALVLGTAVTVLIGVLFERLVLRQMIGRPPFTIIMVTIGLNVLLLTVVTIAIGAKLPRSPAPFEFASGVEVGGVHLEANALATIVTTGLVCAGLYIFFRFTSYGLAMRAAALDQEAALAMGIKLSVVNAIAWAIAGGIATIAGIFLAANNPTFDVSLGNTALVAFPAIILGGLDSIPGAVLGGIVIGVIYELLQGYASHFTGTFGTGFYVIVPYLVMILVLLIRPYGLFGTREVERV